MLYLACFLLFGVGLANHMQARALPNRDIESMDNRSMIDKLVFNSVAARCTPSFTSDIGDFNGDSARDILIGCPNIDTHLGQAFVVYGKNRGSVDLFTFTTSTESGLLVHGSSPTFGTYIQAAGDLNGDELADILVAGTGTSDIYAIFGSSMHDSDIYVESLPLSLGFKIYGFPTDWQTRVFATAGDMNGDNLSDIVLGLPMFSTEHAVHCGMVMVLFSPFKAQDIDIFAAVSSATANNSTSSIEGIRIYGALAGDRIGSAVAGGQDVNNDGMNDLLIGMPHGVYVVFGTGGASDYSLGSREGEGAHTNGQGYTIYSTDKTVELGYSVSFVGDVNGDSEQDFAFSVADQPTLSGEHNSTETQQNGVVAVVIYGTDTLSTATSHLNDLQLDAIPPERGFLVRGLLSSNHKDLPVTVTVAVTAAGDVNNDGIADLLINTQDQSFIGPAFVLYGTTEKRTTVELQSLESGPTITGCVLQGGTANSNFGSSSALGASGTWSSNGASQFLFVDQGVNASDPDTPHSNAVFLVSSTDICPQIGDTAGVEPFTARRSSKRVAAPPAYLPIRRPTYATNITHPTLTTTSVLPVDYHLRNGTGVVTRVQSRTSAHLLNLSPTAVPTALPTSNRCPGGTMYNNRCFYSATARTWTNCQTHCSNNGWRMLCVDSLATNNFLQNTFSSFTKLWLGLSDRGTENTFSWSSSCSPNNYRNWNTDEPNNFGTGEEDCVEMALSVGKWNDNACGNSNGCGCESTWTAGPTTHPTKAPTCYPTVTPTTEPSGYPSSRPSGQPSHQPISQPSARPSSQPTTQPSLQPSCQPSSIPSKQPSAQPSVEPSSLPTAQPTSKPTSQPTSQPSTCPSVEPSAQPSTHPSVQPSTQPSQQPVAQPSNVLTSQPSRQPSAEPSRQPSAQPTSQPSTQPTSQPSAQPSGEPTSQPSRQPSAEPSAQPTEEPSSQPRAEPSAQPSMQPTLQPSTRPSGQPTLQPSVQPSSQPTSQPTGQPSTEPSGQPSVQPSHHPTTLPTAVPSAQPTTQPSRQPTVEPSRQPSTQPSTQPSDQPTRQPTVQPFVQPSATPTSQPSTQPSVHPSSQPSTRPSAQPTGWPSAQPSQQPTAQPSQLPSGQPSAAPSSQPSAQPSTSPSVQPSAQPFAEPSLQPTGHPSSQPSERPTGQPTEQPNAFPSTQPSSEPSSQPSQQPSALPSALPSNQPSQQPQSQPSSQPTDVPSVQTSSEPSSRPSAQPSDQPSMQPIGVPTAQPSEQPTNRPTAKLSRYPSALFTAQPSGQPNALPSGQPSEQPSIQPSSLPSVSPSAQPSSQPSLQSAEPTGHPTSRPSRQPTGRPSSQHTTEPSCQPSAQPSSELFAQLSTQPMSQSSSQPSVGPSSQPNIQPKSEPTRQPSAQPSVSPTQQPHADPTGQPSEAPSERPTSDWAVTLGQASQFTALTSLKERVWVCSAMGQCETLSAATGNGKSRVNFPGNIDTIFGMEDTNAVVIIGHNVSLAKTVSQVSTCRIAQGNNLLCELQSYADIVFTATSYIPYPAHGVHLSQFNNYPGATVYSIGFKTVQGYVYSMSSMGSVVLSHIQSPPNFVGSFVAGTGIRAAGDLSPCIVLGTLRSDFGGLSAMYLTPMSGSILNSAELVNAMALEYEHPDSFIAGGLQLSDGAGMHAYVIRANGLFESVLYCMRYRLRAVENRRGLTSTAASSTSVARDVLYIEGSLYMMVGSTRFVNTTVNGAHSVSIVRIIANTGEVTKQVNIAARIDSVSCNKMTATGLYVTMLCALTHASNNATQSNLLISFDQELSFKKLPAELVRDDPDLYESENVPFSLTVFAVTTAKATTSVSQSEDTQPPSVAPTRSPSWRPSSVPSGQPSSSPTAAPSVSPQPTSHPSTGGPTNTYKPTVKPTQRPSRVPSRGPTVSPTVRPTTTPTASPSDAPTALPSTEPSVESTVKPSRAPTIRPSRAASVPPSVKQSASPTVADTVQAPASSDNQKDDSVNLVIGGSVTGAVFLCWFVYVARKYRNVWVNENAKRRKKEDFLAREEKLWLKMLQRRKEILLEAERAAVLRRKFKTKEQQRMFALASVIESSGEESSASGSSFHSSDDSVESSEDYTLSSLHSSEMSQSESHTTSASSTAADQRTFSHTNCTNHTNYTNSHESKDQHSDYSSDDNDSLASISERDCHSNSCHSLAVSAQAKSPHQVEKKIFWTGSESLNGSETSVSDLETSSENLDLSQNSKTEESHLDAMEAGKLVR